MEITFKKIETVEYDDLGQPTSKTNYDDIVKHYIKWSL